MRERQALPAPLHLPKKEPEEESDRLLFVLQLGVLF
jgi:hypothetical protein